MSVPIRLRSPALSRSARAPAPAGLILTRRQARHDPTGGGGRPHWAVDLLFVASLCVVLVAGLGGAGASGRAPVGADDVVLARAVQRAIERDLGVAAAGRISVVSDAATVTLTGVVSAPHQRVRAAVEAGNVFGVRRVINRIRIS